MKIVFATNNKHKLDEVSAIVQNRIKLLSLADINCKADIPETADTLEGNALLKAQYVATRFGFNCFGDDTGLEIEALNGEPGVFSARYAGSEHSFEENMNKVLAKLEGNPDRRAQFRTVIALILNEKEYFFEGVIKGSITTKKQGATGFGYDPIFKPDGYDQTFAELGVEIKNKISHRALAVQKLCDFLVKVQS